MKYLKLLLLATIVVTLTQCEVDSEIETNIESNLLQSVNQQQTREFTGKIKRVRIKKKRIGSGYKIRVLALATGGIHHYTAIVEGREGVTPVPATFNLLSEGDIDEEGNKIFKLNELTFDGENPDGKPFLFQITPVDIDNNPIGDTEKVWLTVQDNDGVYVSTVQVNETNNPDKFKIKSKITGENVPEIGSVFMQISTLDGTQSIPLEMGEAIFEEGDKPTTIKVSLAVTYQNNSQQEPLKITPGDDVDTTIIIYANNGDVIDELSFIGTIMPKMEMEGIAVGNVSIKQRNNLSTFKLKIPVSGLNRSEVNSIDVVFSDYSGPEPIPTEVSLQKTGENTYVDFYTTNEVSFDTPEAAVGETYIAIIDLQDSEGNAIGSSEVAVTVEGNE